MNTCIRNIIRNTPFLALKISKSGVGVYFRTPSYVLLSIWSYQGHVRSIIEAKSYLYYLHATSKSEIHICSNKHKTDLVVSSVIYECLITNIS